MKTREKLRILHEGAAIDLDAIADLIAEALKEDEVRISKLLDAVTRARRWAKSWRECEVRNCSVFQPPLDWGSL